MILCSLLLATLFTFVELNCENLFDYQHDEGKEDMDWTPGSTRHWNKPRYWRKLNNIGQEIISCGEQPSLNAPKASPQEWKLPDMVALCEVENDSVMKDLTKRSLLRNAGYEYLVTEGPDLRGIDVALLYSPASFRLIDSYPLRVTPVKGMRPTRDILYACGEIISGDTLHVFVVHAPSRYGGEKVTRPNRLAVGERLMLAIDSLRMLEDSPCIIVAGDFNDRHDGALLRYLHDHRLHNVSEGAWGLHGARATYKYQGKWENIDHILVSNALVPKFLNAYINDAEFLLEEDKKYGGVQPHRNYKGMRYQKGFSDHLPLVARFEF